MMSIFPLLLRIPLMEIVRLVTFAKHDTAVNTKTDKINLFMSVVILNN